MAGLVAGHLVDGVVYCVKAVLLGAGSQIDTVANAGVRGKLAKISQSDSKVDVWVVPTNEELLIARDTLALITK